MPEKKTMARARADAAQGKSASTQAGEFVREEIHHIREGKHGARSTKQAIAIGLSKARRSGVKLGVPKRRASAATKAKAKQDLERGRSPRAPSRRRSRATEKALEREPRRAGSGRSLAKQARTSAKRRSPAERSAAAKKAAATKGPAVRRRAAKKAAVTRRRRAHA